METPESFFLLQWLHGFALWLLSSVHIALALAVTLHALMKKEEVHKAVSWIGLAWLAPFGGAFAYWLLGINRIGRTGVALGLRQAWNSDGDAAEAFAVSFDAVDAVLAGVARVGQQVTGKPLLGGNSVQPLTDGDNAYPAMLAAMDAAEHSITLQTYIFHNDKAGQAFVEALARAHARGVQVRVLVDAVGARYRPTGVLRRLRNLDIPCASFLRPSITRLLSHVNLRNHRKILVVDGEVGFTGGMNISANHWFSTQPSTPVHCLHFEVRGPVVTDMQRAFATDWAFTTRERLQGAPWFAPPVPRGSLLARGVTDGPDADIDHMRQVILGSLAAARQRVRIVTPYFLPDEVVLSTLQTTALRGVAVDIVLPARSNLPLLDWAMRPQCDELLAAGCRIHLTPPPFDHGKLFVVDDDWALIGSTNWDARSLRLNFEYNLECYDEALVAALDPLIDGRIAQATLLDADTLARQSLPARLRNRLVWLLSPYL
ncbi:MULTISPECIES: phosphatidylserine/phosphatidylglycerophosphate/cardiolipin synthase family protein [unclassified Simplicispira]|uniref:phospholipase D-like domain-containing protein n=1 Tax=unclassified Simplicispira TaxID=2630407 RepID=UPI000D5EB648|nr:MULTISPECIES: phospholipase D-like domain-containing protein [unclassified Simplicispira]PVY55678.1 cardiolipin synthetase 2 [Simplicispira sp. 125]REG16621.1 cardiolipin synthetase 2 [Simplicispira sp. 110]